MNTQTPLTDKELDDIADRAEAASPGPWRAWVEGREGFSGDNVILMGSQDADGPDMYVTHAYPGHNEPAPIVDLDFIANARQDVPRLVAEIRRLRRRTPPP